MNTTHTALLQAQISGILLSMLENNDRKVPFTDAAIPLFNKRLQEVMDEFENVDFDEVERRNDEKLDAQEEVKDESDCEGCKI